MTGVKRSGLELCNEVSVEVQPQLTSRDSGGRAGRPLDRVANKIVFLLFFQLVQTFSLAHPFKLESSFLFFLRILCLSHTTNLKQESYPLI